MALMLKKEATLILEPHFQSVVEAISLGWHEYVRFHIKLAYKYRAETRAGIVRDYVVSHAASIFSGVEGVNCFRTGKNDELFFLRINDKLLVQFKKIGKDFLTQNYPTEYRRKFNGQLPLSDLPDGLPRITAGYIPKVDWSWFDSIYMTCQYGKGIFWKIQLDIQRAVQQPLFIRPASHPIEPPVFGGGRVSRKENNISEAVSGGDNEGDNS